MKSVVAGLIVLVTLASFGSSARAQPALTPPVAPPGYELAPVVLPEKSEGSALMWALGATTLGYLAGSTGDGNNNNSVLPWIAAAGILVGPSAGHIYAGEHGHAVKMTLLRTGGMALLVAGIIKSFTVAVDDSNCIDYCGRSSGNDGELLILAGAATFITATVYDLIDAPRAARRFNAKQKEQKQRMWQVAPTMTRDASGAASPAFALSGRW